MSNSLSLKYNMMYTHSDQRLKQNFWKYKGAQFRWGMKLILNEKIKQD